MIPAETRSTPTERNATWVPVISQVPGHVQIRFLHGRVVATGWVPANTVDIADTGAWVEIRLAAKTVTLHTIGKADKTWSAVAVGSAGSRWPTPVGDYWVERVGKFTDPTTIYGPGPRVELSARGSWRAPDLIAIHTYLAPVKRGASSHGCIRIGPASTALAVLGKLPAGTTVEIRP